MQSFKRQQGLSLIAAAGLLFLIVFFGLLVIRLSGPYLDYFTINKMIESAIENDTSSRFDASAFESRIQKNIDINNLSIGFKDSIKIDRRATPVKITLDYEERVSLFLNVDVVLSFNKEFEL